MDNGDSTLERLGEILEALKSGRAKVEDFADEIAELSGTRFAPMVALLAADNIHDRYEAEELSAAEAGAMIQAHADRFPTVPILFMYRSFYAHEQGEDLDSIGYLALYRMKGMQIEEFSDFGLYPEREEILRPLFDVIEDDPRLMSIWPYLEEGGEHLIAHLLVQEITMGRLDPDGEWLDIILARLEKLEPLLVNMLEDQLRLRELTSCEAPGGLHILIAVVGCRKSLDALPVLEQALAVCVCDPLNEALLALAKLGTLYPSEVSRILRDMAGDGELEEVRLAAIDGLGLLWEAPGNLDFLRGMLAGLTPEEYGFDELFMFLSHALLSTGDAAAAREVSSHLSEHLGELDSDAVLFVEDYLEHYRDIQLGPRLDDILAEEPEDFLVWPPSDLVREWRSTLTLQREDALLNEGNEGLQEYDLELVETYLREGRNDPCSCGSGLKFKKCCLPRMEDLRERLLREEDVPVEKTPYAALMTDLMSYARLPSIRAEREEGIDIFLKSLGRTWFERDIVPGSEGIEASFFDDWFVVSRPLNKSGKTVAQEMLAADGEDLDPATAALLRGLAESRFSVYEVLEAVPGKEMRLRDVFRGGEVKVRERTASSKLVKWDLLATRVGEVGDHNELMGVSLTIPRNYLDPTEEFVTRTSKEMIKDREIKDIDEFLQRHGHLVFHQVTHLLSTEPRPVSITPEGDEFVLCTAVYDVGDAAKVRRLLAGHPYIEDTGTKAGTHGFAWHMSRQVEDELRQGEHLGPQNKARTFGRSPKEMTEKDEKAEMDKGNLLRIFGSLALKSRRLTFQTQSRQRLEEGKRELDGLLAGVATHRADTIQDQEALLGEAWRNRGQSAGEAPSAASRMPDIPPEAIEAAMKEVMERTYADWLDEPIPYLDGKTPRQAAKTAKGRKKVNRLLQEYENQAERDKKEGRPTYDFSRFRRELDVWPD